jgi:hypothetical protein
VFFVGYKKCLLKNNIIVKRNLKFKIFNDNFFEDKFVENGPKRVFCYRNSSFFDRVEKKIDIRSVKYICFCFSPHCELSPLTNTEPTPERWIRPWL